MLELVLVEGLVLGDLVNNLRRHLGKKDEQRRHGTQTITNNHKQEQSA